MAPIVRAPPRWVGRQKEGAQMRPPASLSKSLHHKLNAYALAATAAGVSASARAATEKLPAFALRTKDSRLVSVSIVRL